MMNDQHWLVSVPHQGAPSAHTPHEVAEAWRAGRIPRDAPVSNDGGRSWQPIGYAFGGSGQAPEVQGLELIVPIKVQPDALIVGYLAIFSLLFFGGPISFLTAILGWDAGPKSIVRFGAVAVGLLLGPLPIGLYARHAHKRLLANPEARGMARVYTAYVCAALMGLGVAVGLVGAVVQALKAI
jgi:hypothetical protein